MREDDGDIGSGDLHQRVTRVLTGEVQHRYFVRSGERVVAVVTAKVGFPNATSFVHVDHLGSTDALTDQAGNVHRRSYDAFGARRNTSWGGPPPPPVHLAPPGFTGHEDDELGLVNMKGRIYDPAVGRFMTPDPFVAQPGFGQSWNPYRSETDRDPRRNGRSG